jgi:hypothetical protein
MLRARERWSRENSGNYSELRYTTVAGGEGRKFSYLLESHMTYLAGSHVLRSWPGIWLIYSPQISRSQLSAIMKRLKFDFNLATYIHYAKSMSELASI